MSASEPEVFHFLIEPRVGGILKVALSVKARVRGYRNTIVACGDGPGTEIKLANIRRPFRALYFFEFIVNLFLIFFRFFLVARRKRVIFHVHSNNNNAPLFIAALLRVPVVWHFHSVMDANSMVNPLVVKIFAEQRRISKVALATLPHRMVCASEGCVPTWGLDANKAIVIDSPLDVDYWSMAAWGGERKAEATGLRMLNVANLNHLKGHDVLMDALALLNDERVAIDVIGPELPGFRAYAKALYEHPNAHQVTQHGGQERDAIRAMLGERGAFILPSRTEACPVSLCEAMAMGCFCIATRVGSVPRFLADGRGILCEPDDPASLAEALRQALAMTPKERAAMGERARAYVLERCTESVVAAQYEELYADLLNEAYGSPSPLVSE